VAQENIIDKEVSLARMELVVAINKAACNGDEDPEEM
jgi:hypothetical protein